VPDSLPSAKRRHYWCLDGFGGVHGGGGASGITPDTPYFGVDIARDIELGPGGGYYLLDGLGGVHLGDGAAACTPAAPHRPSARHPPTSALTRPATWRFDSKQTVEQVLCP